MNRHYSNRYRLLAFSAAIVTMLVLIAWAAHTSWQQLNSLHEAIDEEELGSFDIADAFQAKIHSTNYTLVRFGTHETNTERERFEQQSRELAGWLDERKAVLTTPREREVLDQIDHAYDTYLATARQVITVAQNTNDYRLIFEALEKAAQSSKPLLDLGYSLAVANREAGKQWRHDLRRSLGRLQIIIFSSLVTLLALGCGTSAFVYWQLIAPLHSQLAEKRELIARQEKLASLGVLAAGVAHEIRNPLTAIKLRLFTLRAELAAAEADTEDVQVIAGEIDRLDQIVTEFLQFARPAEPNMEAVFGSRIITEVRDLMKAELASRGVEMRTEVIADPSLRADLRQMKQVLLNLVRNAAESIEEGGGTVTMRTRSGEHMLQLRNAPCAIIEVEDSGKGIPTDIQKRLFDPFFSTKETGTGLGLSIAARIVEHHGGVLKFETLPGQGTIFQIILPLAP